MILLAGRALGDPVRLGGRTAVIAIVITAWLVAFLIGARIEAERENGKSN